MPKLRTDSIETQLLPLLSLFREKYTTGMRLNQALSEATRQIAADHETAYQTIADGYTRRLNFTGPRATDRFRDLLRKWVDDGNPGPLAALAKAHSHEDAHSSIDAVLLQSPLSPAPHDPIVRHPYEAITFELPQSEARMLRAFAANDGVTEGEFVGQVVRAALAAKMKAVAQQLWPSR